MVGSDNQSGYGTAIYDPQPTDEEVETFRVNAEKEAALAPDPVHALENGYRDLPRLVAAYGTARSLRPARLLAGLAGPGCPVCGTHPWIAGASLCWSCEDYVVALALPDSVAADGRSASEIMRRFRGHLRKQARKRGDKQLFWRRCALRPRERLQEAMILAKIYEGVFTRDVQ